MGLRMKNYGSSLKNQYRGLWKTNIDSRYGWAKKRGLVFLKRGVDTLMYTPKLHALLHKTCIKVIKVLRLDMCTSMITLSKIVQMWCDHPFSRRNKTTEWAMAGGGWKQQGRTTFEKRKVSNIGGVFIK